VTSELILDNNKADNSKRTMEEEIKFPFTDIKDAGAFIPISISEAIRIEKRNFLIIKKLN